MISVGVEEEFLLLDPVTGLPVAQAEQVQAAARLQPPLGDRELSPELLQAQVETATPVCRDLSEVGGHLLRLRHATGVAAEKCGCRIAACAAAPFSCGTPVPVADSPRYRAMREQAPRLVEEQLINGMHVHVGVEDRRTGVAVLNRIRPWLPVLLALSASSPLWCGADTGFASWRTLVFGRWPVSGPPPHFADADDYEERCRTLLGTGTIRDLGQLYWHARLSERYPTVEVRVADVQLRCDDAVMVAGLTRALVATALHEEERRLPQAPPPGELLAAATWHAARSGLGGNLVDPRTGAARRAGDVLGSLLDHVAAALDEAGDTREVASLVHRLLREGTGADRQREALRRGPLAVVDLVTRETVSG
ncbi:glutamate--cysteine ligase [Streptomyces sp. NPDC001380]|uniref:carboxylate-amine ligase n=1 Tax=Streptomyces sp. NPDC001380 TaxID=3364566 RepID=UPI0036BD55D3